MTLEPVLAIIEISAIVVFAISGLIEAVRKRMDVVGVFAVAFVTAFGGGTLRDVLLDRRPLFWVQHQEYDNLTRKQRNKKSQINNLPGDLRFRI